MPKSSALALAGLVLVLGACSSNAPAASTPADGGGGGGQPTATTGSEATEPGSGGGTGGSFSGDLKDLAARLVPDGSSETSKLEAQGVYQLYVTSNLSLDQLKAFYDSRIPSLGMTLEAKVESGGGLYISTSHPVGAIIVAPDSGGAGFAIAISLSTE